MQRVSIGRRLGRRWMLVVAVGVLAVAGFDDVVKDERSVNTANAYTYCLDKSG